MASTDSLSPLTTLKTPSGRPDSFNNSASLIAHDGSFSDGFKIKVFPHAHEAYYQLAACYTALGQQQQAKQMQQLALDKIPATYRKVLRP